jgi:hypothetical protein
MVSARNLSLKAQQIMRLPELLKKLKAFRAARDEPA